MLLCEDDVLEEPSGSPPRRVYQTPPSPRTVKCMLEGDRLSEADVRLNGDPIPAEEIEAALREAGFLRDDWDIQRYNDPMLMLLLEADSTVTLEEEDGSGSREVHVLTHALESCYQECCDNYGPLFSEAPDIMEHHANLMASNDTHAKQFLLLCMLTVERGLQNSLATLYPKEGMEIQRLAEYLPKIHALVDSTLNTSYGIRPNEFNVDFLIAEFLRKAMALYPG